MLNENYGPNYYDCDRREILQNTASHLVDLICAYRAGYAAEVSKSVSLLLSMYKYDANNNHVFYILWQHRCEHIT